MASKNNLNNKSLVNYRHGKMCILICIYVFIGKTVFGQRDIQLYGNKVPNAKGNCIDKINEDKSVFHRVCRPTLRMYLGKNEIVAKTAVIICAGGGYAELNIKREGYAIAEAFEKTGVAAFVLRYRLPDDKTNLKKSIAPLQDAQQAIKMVRDSAKNWNIDPNKVGIMGFSAGGHLASSAGVHYNDVLITNASITSLRPDFMLLVYPVISFNDAFGHIGSRNNLLGSSPASDSVAYFSNELFVNSQTPSTFLTHAGDDKIVSVENSVRFYEALNKNGVPADLHIYAKGGHGYGTTPAFGEWFGRCLNWMRTMELIN